MPIDGGEKSDEPTFTFWHVENIRKVPFPKNTPWHEYNLQLMRDGYTPTKEVKTELAQIDFELKAEEYFK